MDPVMYIIMASPHTTPMSPGKLAAQAAHAAVEAWQISDKNKQVVNRWYAGGHYKKVVLMSDNLELAERYIKDRGFKTVLIIDEGRTEFDGRLTPTAIGVEVVDKDELHVRETFSVFMLYAPEVPIAHKARGGRLDARPYESIFFSDRASWRRKAQRQIESNRRALARTSTRPEHIQVAARRSERIVEWALRQLRYVR
jgi:peptidyl-tRNA hydrolase